ncbi:heat shock factor protein 2-like isoform X2 [Sinocyclocheilus rhinocerous]|uniref:Heat shock factor protein 2-like n=1 Tax=Sinocyclocheilus rhinocerous TaxID=307959 RepID=A0A673MWW5_9TELE|nr:PREDICTED: heat shock factor protein 2-like isoform X1 [Sinocyclocheilus rhinocerous]XP_016393095.1 PREDICTED: heat shock factor protein 2-like isoform X2 [Sinocyclocheilus rhinocerous]
MKHNSNVPGFITKLWTLVEDSDTNEFICWSQEGNSFLVLDEQRFAKEILPKFFKHNNMASFVRQLNMYGFRKVMHIDTGIVKQERDGPVEFQHPYFKHGQDDLLENIKRKVSHARPEESKIRQDDLSTILTSVQNVHEQQENMDARLATLKRENEALWTALSDLRQKHAQQQQVIKELVQFIFTLVQNNRMLNLKRKRPLTLNSNGKKSKFIHQIFEEPMDHSKSAVNGLNGLKNSSDISEDVVICDITEEDAEFTDGVSVPADQGDAEIVEVACESSPTIRNDSTNETGTNSTTQQEAVPKIISDILSSTLQLNKPSALSSEDPVKLMNSILSENGAISQNINLLGKVELMDYLDSIDCSLEDFQAMLYGKQFSIDPDIIQEAVSEAKDSIHKGKPEPDNTDKQLIQYTTCPLLAFIDGCTPLAPPDSPTEYLCQPILPQSPENITDLLDKDLETETPRSSLIRLEPLTEAEASETTLFYLCELNSDLSSDDTPQLDI